MVVLALILPLWGAVIVLVVPAQLTIIIVLTLVAAAVLGEWLFITEPLMVGKVY